MKKFAMAAAVFVAALFLVWLYFKTDHTSVVTEVVSGGVIVQASPVVSEGVAESAANATTGVETRLRNLDEILRSRNDNDPRLDNAFNNLSAEEKKAFRKRYRELAAERRNEKGTIVYLLGRNLTEPEDFEFMNEVLNEPPCLSMANCSKDSPEGKEAHSDIGVDVSLAYPQIVALKRIEKMLEGGRSTLTTEALKSVRIARGSKAPVVSSIAADIEQRFSR
jgi:hypothetical protein